jgi:preprotein translocase subunit SecG
VNSIVVNILSTALVLGALLLVGIILLQRGRGGGLAGAFGGAGGQSAFGTRAGDVFTRLTLGIAVAWVTLAVVTGYVMAQESGKTRFPGAEGKQLGAASLKVQPFRPLVQITVTATEGGASQS